MHTVRYVKYIMLMRRRWRSGDIVYVLF